MAKPINNKMNRKKFRTCTICKIEIKVEIKKIGRPTGQGGIAQNLDSDEGVLFILSNSYKGGYWFCNDCWEEIRK